VISRLAAAAILLTGLALADEPKSTVSLVAKAGEGKVIVQPVFPLRFRVEQESGAPVQKSDFLQCEATGRKRMAKIDGQDADVTEIVFECRNKVRLVIREVLFEAKD
jgi:hypothetical protein